MLKDWIRQAREKGASDLHLEAGTPPVFRVRGELGPAGHAIPGDLLLQSVRELLTPPQWQEFTQRRSYDLSKTVGGTRCRINIYQTIRGVGLAIRILSAFQNSLRDCNLHPELSRFTDAKTGLVLVSGPTGSGKSTTLAALIEEMNLHQRRQIIMIESPIEYFFANHKSFIRQREVPLHTPSFEQAIVDSMRENPDVLVIGEMRTPDVMRLTLNAAETGHLVLATMHSATCAEALARICMSFAPEIQGAIRAQLADCLVGVVCQRLTYSPQYQLRLPHLEVLVANQAARSNLRTGQFSQLLSTIQAGGEDGMWTFDRYQRWMELKKDWVRPQQARPLEAAGEPTPPEELTRTAFAPPVRTPTPRRPRIAPPPVPEDQPPPPPGSAGRLELQVSDEDLEELAKKISDDDWEPGGE